jgi:hypothetical protein
MTLADAINWLQATPISVTIRESDWVFPTIESLHVIAFVLVVGSIAVVDLRLIGVASGDRPAHDLITELLPITWIAFAVAVIAGALLFIGKPVTYTKNVFFLCKMALILLAGLNMGVFHLFVQKHLINQKPGEPPVLAARASGLASLALWIAVVACGRWIGFSSL